LKGSPSTKKLPPATEETKTGGFNETHSSAIEDATASAIDDNPPEATATDKHEDIISENVENEPVAATLEENGHVGAPAEEAIKSASEIPAASEDKAGAIQPPEVLVNDELQKPNIEASQSIPEVAYMEMVVAASDTENPASKSVEIALDAVEPVITDEPKGTNPIVPELKEDYETTNDAPEALKEDKAEETVMAT
jgi:hypothetical protein